MSPVPGPWSTLTHDDGAISVVVSGGLRVARVDTVQWPREVVERHARLIASAPSLLAELRECADRLETCARFGGNSKEIAAIAVQRYRETIARADGRSRAEVRHG